MDGSDLISSIIVIGVVTLILSMIGVGIGSKVGEKFGKHAEFLGGVILVCIGIKVLVEHLNLL